MKQFKAIIPLLLACFTLLALLGAKSGKTPPPPPPPVWKLIWADNFDGPRIDTKKWNIADHTVTNYDGGINFYDTSNVFLYNGTLVIRSLCQDLDRQIFWSGRAMTKNKFSFLYGKVEVRAKLPGSRGMWPAIWMLQSDGAWPPEIDIMEMLGDDPQRVYMTHHWGKHKEDLTDQTDFFGPDFTDDFHTFTVEWQPHQIRWLIDDVERKVVTENVPNKAMYLILNTSVGGEWLHRRIRLSRRGLPER